MTNEQLESLPATGRRKHAGRPIRLQERDLDLLTSLAVGRFLTVHALEWLHYPDWRERYRAFLERRKADPTLIFYPTPNLYRRLTALRTGAEPLVYRIARTLERASLVFNRLPDAYTLSVSGAELLCTRRGYELADLWYEDTHTRSIKNFRYNESPIFFLNNLEAIGPTVRINSSESASTGGAVFMPPIKVRDFNFTSLSDAV